METDEARSAVSILRRPIQPSYQSATWPISSDEVDCCLVIRSKTGRYAIEPTDDARAPAAAAEARTVAWIAIAPVKSLALVHLDRTRAS